MYIHVQYNAFCPGTSPNGMDLCWRSPCAGGGRLATLRILRKAFLGLGLWGERRLFEEFLYSCMSHRNQIVKFIQCFRLALWRFFLESSLFDHDLSFILHITRRATVYQEENLCGLSMWSGAPKAWQRG